MEQKPIGLIGAMKIEVDAILAALENTRQETHGGMAFTQGVLSGVEVVVAQCSPGKVNAALCAQAMIDHYSPRLVLNLGVAGGIGENVHIGDVVIATACVEYDFDTSALDQWPAGQLTLPGYEEPMRFLPCGQTLAHILSRAAEGLYGRAHLGIVATGDKFVADPRFGEYLQKESGALACVSVSNTQLGERSAEMAFDILQGKAVAEVPAEAMTTFQYVCSAAAAETLGIALPEDGSVTVIG